jgi:hypothetical protein
VKRANWLVAILAFVALLFVAACGGSSELPTQPTATVTAPASTVTVTPTPSPLSATPSIQTSASAVSPSTDPELEIEVLRVYCPPPYPNVKPGETFNVEYDIWSNMDGGYVDVGFELYGKNGERYANGTHDEHRLKLTKGTNYLKREVTLPAKEDLPKGEIEATLEVWKAGTLLEPKKGDETLTNGDLSCNETPGGDGSSTTFTVK